MKSRNIIGRARLGTALALAISVTALGSAAQAAQPTGTYKPSARVLLSVGEGQMVNLPRSAANVWTSNPDVADVFVSSPRQMSLFGKGFGEATIIATASDGSVVYGANVHVSENVTSINEALRRAMPDSNITVTTIGQMAVLNGTVASPDDATQAESLVRSLLNPGVKPGDALKIMPVNRLKTAVPLQVTLKVRVAEVNRSVLKQFGMNLLANSNGKFQFGIAQGNGISIPPVTDYDPTHLPKVIRNDIGSTLSGVGKLFGLDIISALDIAADDGLASILAEPNLTALSGETASFLAGGEFPIPVSQALGAVTIEYKQYGVGLAFTPIVLADGRISMRVRPEVSELSDAGSIHFNGYTVPALTTRRAETTVELGSGESLMIGGLIRSTSNNSIDKAPFLGDLPVLGALFRSTKFQKQESELVIIVTPYLVRPVSTQMAAPTDGYRTPTDAQQILMGQTYTGVSGARDPSAVPAPTTVPAGAAPAAAPGFRM